MLQQLASMEALDASDGCKEGSAPERQAPVFPAEAAVQLNLRKGLG